MPDLTPATPPAAPLPTAPHLTEPELTALDAEHFEEWHAAVARGFQEAVEADMLETERKIFEVDRCFGYRAGGRWVATFGALTRDLAVPGGADVQHAAITVVTVHPPYRRRGLLSRMMRHQLEDCVRRGEPLATLWASESLIYGRFGFGPAVTRHVLRGSTRDLTYLPGVRTEGSVEEVTREQYLATAPRLHPELRSDRPGTMSRAQEHGWELSTYDAEHARDGASELRFAVHFAESGEPDGFATYRFKEDYDDSGPRSEVRVQDLWAEGVARASLWRYLLDLDLVRRFRARNVPPDEPLRLLVTDHRAVRTQVEDGLYVRVVDVPAALRLRAYAAPVDVVLDVRDDLLPANTGRWRLSSEGDAATTTVERTDAEPDVSLGVLELGTAYLGGTSLSDLHRAGRVVEHVPGAVASASTAFSWHRAPWCPDSF